MSCNAAAAADVEVQWDEETGGRLKTPRVDLRPPGTHVQVKRVPMERSDKRLYVVL